MKPINVFWFRRDLRLHDNSGLFHALNASFEVLPIFIFDTNILDQLGDKTDARLTFIHGTIQSLKNSLQNWQSDMMVMHGDPLTIWKEIINIYNVNAVYANHDYEPYGLQRDQSVMHFLQSKGIHFYSYKDIVFFEKSEVVKDNNEPYSVFTPYKKTWLSKFEIIKANNPDLLHFPSEKMLDKLLKVNVPYRNFTLKDLGFHVSDIQFPEINYDLSIIKDYDKNRDFPYLNGTSKLGVHLRFGTISIRRLVLKSETINQTFLSELIWRDFYHMILFHFPHVVSGAFRIEYDHIVWENNELNFNAWCEGKTGYPLVDAGMRELKATGYMHNRIRMLTASFLAKHLLIDWRWGEAWFAQHLLDFDLASNNGGWQWAAGCGTDAAPYFRIFSPDAQTEKFDKNRLYIKKWVPEYDTTTYPPPIVDHKFARERCLRVYQAALKQR